jgi:hypothetical protein
VKPDAVIIPSCGSNLATLQFALERLGADVPLTEDPARIRAASHVIRHVPIIFYGNGIARGSSPDRARTVDVAPTLAGLASTQTPDDLDGRPLLSR